MSTSVKLTDYFKNKLKKVEEGITATSGQSITLGDHTLPGITTTVTDRPTLPTTPGNAPTFSEALKVTTPGVTSGNTMNPKLVSGGNNVPNVNAFVPTNNGTYATTADGDVEYKTINKTVKTEPMSFEEYILSLKSKADDQYKRDILNAQNTYDQSRSAYGTQAAALSGMGLTGSGYSDYLDSRAYGQMQADKNAAARTREDTKFAADTKYMEYLNQLEAEKRAKAETDAINKTNAYTSMLSNITYATTEADIENYAKAYGLTDELESLKQTRIDRIKQYLDDPDVEYTLNDLNRFFPNGGAEYDAYKAKLVEKITDIDPNSIGSGADLEAVIAAANQAGVPAEVTNNLLSVYNSLYAVGLYANGGGVTYEGGFNPDSKEDNFEVTLTAWNGEQSTYKVEQGGEVTDAAVISAAITVPNDQVFYYNGGLYMKYNGKIYRVQGRANTEDYDTLVELFKKGLNIK